MESCTIMTHNHAATEESVEAMSVFQLFDKLLLCFPCLSSPFSSQLSLAFLDTEHL